MEKATWPGITEDEYLAITRSVSPRATTHEIDGGITYEADPDFLEHVHREACRQEQLLWDD